MLSIVYRWFKSIRLLQIVSQLFSIALGLMMGLNQAFANCGGTVGVDVVADSGSHCIAGDTSYSSAAGQTTFDAQANSSITISNNVMVTAIGGSSGGTALKAWTGATINSLGTLGVAITGDNASALSAEAGTINVTGLATLSTTGDNSFGAIVNNNGQVQFNGGATITTSGAAHGLIALLEGNITLAAPFAVSTSGARAFGAAAFYSSGASININDTVNITTTGSGSSNTDFLASGPGGLAALLGGVISVNGLATIQGSGSYTTALNSSSGTLTLSKGATITLHGAHSNGIWVTDGLGLNNLMRDLAGFAADSPNVNDPGIISLSGHWMVTTTDATSNALHLSGKGSQLLMTDVNSRGVIQAQGTAIRLDSENSMSLDQRDSGGAVIPGGYGVAKRSTGLIASLVNATISSASGNVIEVAGVGKDTISGINSRLELSNSMVTASGDGKLLNVTSQTVAFCNLNLISSPPCTGTNDSATFTTDGFDFVAKNTQLVGDITVSSDSQNVNLIFQQGTRFTGTIDPANLTVDASSSWQMTGDSDINILTLGGMITSATPASAGALIAKTLTVNSLVGQGGTITLNSNLVNVSDQLIIDGGTVTGTTNLAITLVDAGGLPLSNLLPIVTAINGAVIPAGSFVLNQRVAIGPYTYTLQGDGSANSPIVLSNLITSADGVVRPNYRPEIPVAMTAQALASRLGLAVIGNYRLRFNEDAIAERAYSWGRIFGATGDVDPGSNDFVSKGPVYDFNLVGAQVGRHFYYKAVGEQGFRAGGAYLAISSTNGGVNAAYDHTHAGKLSMQAYTLGAYWTHQAEKNWYIDTVLQATRYANIKSQSSLNEEMSTDGLGIDASIEGGITVPLTSTLALEPQLQLIYQFQKLDSAQDRFGKIDFSRLHASYARVGARLSKMHETSTQPVRPWLGLYLWNNFSGEGTTTFSTLSGNNPTRLNTDLGGTWGQIEVGISAKLSKRLVYALAADYNHSMDSNTNRSFSGRFTLQAQW